MSQEIAHRVKLIRHNAGGVDEPDDPSLPFKLEVHLNPPQFMIVTFVGLYGGSEEVIVRGATKEALDKFAEEYRLRTHPRLRSFVITGPDGVVEEIKK